MCTIIVLNQLRPDYPVVIAANRDEFYSRPTRGPVALGHSPRIAGGLDEERNGTWMGVTEHGLFVGLTNQRSYAPRVRAPGSRGEVVLRALQAGSPDRVRDYLRQLDASRYESFNLIYGDASGLEVAYVRREDAEISAQAPKPEISGAKRSVEGGSIQIVGVTEGISVLSNDRLDAADFPKLDTAHELVAPVAQRPWPELVSDLKQVLADHRVPELPMIGGRAPKPEISGAQRSVEGGSIDLPASVPFDAAELNKLQALCVHTAHYGTRSATIVALQPGKVAHYLYAPGAPCSTELVDATHYVS